MDSAGAADSAETLEARFTARAEAFLAALERAGVPAGIERRARLLALLTLLSAQKRFPADVSELARVITPLFATTPLQQASCGAVLSEVLSPSAGQRAIGLREEPDSPWLRRLLLGGKLAAVALAVMLAVYTAWIYWPVPAPSKPPQQPAASSQQHEPVPLALLPWLRDYPIDRLELPQQSAWNRTWRWYYTEYNAAKWIAVFGSITFGALVLLHVYSRLLARFYRGNLKNGFKLLDGQIPRPDWTIADRAVLQRLQPVRRVALYRHSVLDIDGTVSASIAEGGRLQPRFAEKPVPAVVLAVVDRQDLRDHLYFYHLEMVQALRDAGLWVEVAEFNGDPALCRIQRSGSMVSLSTLIGRFPDSLVLLLGHVDNLVDPLRPHPLASLFALKGAWRAVIMTPFGASTGRSMALVARELGVWVLPSTREGLRALADVLVGERAIGNRRRRGERLAERAALAAFLMERPRRWMQGLRPRPAELQRLGGLLRGALSARGFDWLVSTSIYPELRWSMTMRLRAAAGLPAGRTAQIEDDLSTLATLPWFRQGWMPDWFRVMLQRTQSAGQRRRYGRAMLDALGLDRQAVAGREAVAINAGTRPLAPARALRTDGVMVDYLWPGTTALQPGFVVQANSFRRFLRKRLPLVIVLVLGFGVLSSGVAVGTLSLLPIDECDLYGSSAYDKLRVGPGTMMSSGSDQLLNTRMIIACKKAVQQHPNNARFLYELGRAQGINSKDAEGNLNKAAGLNYKAAYLALGYLYHYRDNFDYLAAEKNYKLFAHENIEGIYNLAKLYEDKGEIENYLSLSEKYVNLGGSHTFNLALTYRDGEISNGKVIASKDHKKYLYYINLGHNRGDPLSDMELGQFELESGNFIRARELYRSAAAQFIDINTAERAALSYADPRYGSLDYERATYWAILASKLGSSEGQALLVELIRGKKAVFDSGHLPSEADLAPLLDAFP